MLFRFRPACLLVLLAAPIVRLSDIRRQYGSCSLGALCTIAPTAKLSCVGPLGGLSCPALETAVPAACGFPRSRAGKHRSAPPIYWLAGVLKSVGSLIVRSGDQLGRLDRLAIEFFKSWSRFLACESRGLEAHTEWTSSVYPVCLLRRELSKSN